MIAFRASNRSVERMMDSSKTISSTEDEMSKAAMADKQTQSLASQVFQLIFNALLLMARMLLPVILDVPMNDENRYYTLTPKLN